MGKRALILRGGTIEGAFAAGAIKFLHKKFGPDYFDVIYSTSVGVFEQAFYAAREPHVMENIWRNDIYGNKLINFFNLFKGRPILNLDYLIRLFQSEDSRLNLKTLYASKAQLLCVVTNYNTREPAIINLKSEEIFKIMRATCALPFLYTNKIYIDGVRYIDGGLSIGKAFDSIIKKLDAEGFSEIIVVVSKKNLIKASSSIVKILEPSKMPLFYQFDTNRKRIIRTIEQGFNDARLLFDENDKIKT
ncbi:MAG: patatin-like phospholipase family protein [Candidatus Liptonbacteria bacterium]|nr:patatin-like phospholipase family protein [Candidatus Liptonbacteria bacterium]